MSVARKVQMGGGDPYFPYVEVLFHMDGADAATSFPDSSKNSHTVTCVGSGQLDTAQQKFGTASFNAPADGDACYIPNGAPVLLGSEDWTIEFFVRVTATPAPLFVNAFCGIYDTSTNDRSYSIGLLGGDFRVALSSDGTTKTEMTATHGFSTNTWYHIAVVRDGNTIRAYKDGTAYTLSSSTWSSALHASSADLYIGDYDDGLTHAAYGWIDEFRLTKGIARYNSNFTAPTVPFPNN